MKLIYSILFLSCFAIASCHTEFLEIKPDQRLAVPSSLKDLEALMDNSNVMNTTALLIMGEIGTDDHYLNETDWNTLTNPYQKNGYLWKKDIYEGQQCVGWNRTYEKVIYANIVLEGIDKIARNNTNAAQWDRIKGTALFWRGWQFFQLAQVFCNDYEKQTAAQEMGIPLRLSSDINQPNARANIENTYQQIVQDLSKAASLLPAIADQKTRPSKQAVHALLSRCYLQMKEYALAKEQADRCFAISDKLIDYNKLNTNLSFPFPLYSFGNVEQPLFNVMLEIQLFFSFLKVDSVLLSLYDPHDLRFSVYYSKLNNYYIFKGSYNGYETFNPFPALDEVYLIRAECNQRLGQSTLALEDLNTLLMNRYEKDKYKLKTIANTSDILAEIITERRKSLVFRGVRWSDLRRLRKEPAFAKTLTRKLGASNFELKPEQSSLYTWPIPDDVITLGNISQNNR